MSYRLIPHCCLALLGLAAVVSTAAADSPGCCDGCPPGYKKTCVPVPSTKTVIHRVYGDICEDFCLPKCSFFGHHGGCGDCASCGNCEKVRTRKVLVVKQRKCEECEHKCEVQLVPCAPACAATPCCGGTVIYQGQPMILLQGQPATGTPRLEQAPMPSPKK